MSKSTQKAIEDKNFYVVALQNLSNALDSQIEAQKGMSKIKKNMKWLEDFNSKLLRRN